MPKNAGYKRTPRREQREPLTAAGRIVAVAIMLTGIGLLGVVTASVAAAFVRWAAEPIEAEGEAEHREQRLELNDVAAELKALRAQIAELSSRLPAATPDGRGRTPRAGGTSSCPLVSGALLLAGRKITWKLCTGIEPLEAEFACTTSM